MNSKEKIKIFQNEMKRIEKEIESLKFIKLTLYGNIKLEEIKLLKVNQRNNENGK